MRPKPFLASVMIVVASMLTTGCWDRIELEQRATVLGLSIDPVSDERVANQTGLSAKSTGLGFKLTAQVAIPGRIPLGPGGTSGGTASEKPLWVLSASGKTVDDAMNSLQRELAEKVFLGHLRVIIINKSLAESEGVHDIQDFLRRNAEIRRLAWMIISTGSAADAMNASPKLERVPTLYLVNMMDQAVKLGTLPNIFLGNFWSVLSAKGQDAVLPIINVVSPEQVNAAGLAVFRNEKMVGELDSLETAAYMEMQNQRKSGYSLAVPMPSDPTNSVTLRGVSRHSIREIHFTNGRPVFDIYTRIDANIEEKTGRGAVDQVIDVVAAEASSELVNNQQRLIAKMKELDTDVFGFGEYLRAKEPGYWARIQTRDVWLREFPNLRVNVHIKVNIRRSGMAAH